MLVSPLYDRRSAGARIPELDGLRGIAILLVITKHYGLVGFSSESEWGHAFNQFYRSLSGVDLFFVLSGFLLGSRLLDALHSPHYYSRFYRSRFYRTFPAYLLVLAVFTVLAYLQRQMGIYSPGLYWPFSSLWLLVVYYLFLQNVWIAYDGSPGPRGLEVTWSLALQEQFYLLLPVLLRRITGRGLLVALAALALLGPVARVALVTLEPRLVHHYYDYLFLFRADTLCAGVLLAALLRGPQSGYALAKYRNCLPYLTSAVFLLLSLQTIPGLAPDEYTSFTLGYSWVGCAYSMLILTAVLCPDSLVSRTLRARALRELGLISYGLFLYHESVNEFLHAFLLGASPATRDWQSLLTTIDALLLTVVLADLSWHFLEKPLIRQRNMPSYVSTHVGSVATAP